MSTPTKVMVQKLSERQITTPSGDATPLTPKQVSALIRQYDLERRQARDSNAQAHAQAVQHHLQNPTPQSLQCRRNLSLQF